MSNLKAPIRPSRRRLSTVLTGGALAALVALAITAGPANADSVLTTIPSAGGGTVANTVAVSPDGAVAYTADGTAGTVSLIDTATNTVTGTLPVPGATALVVSPQGDRLYVTVFALDSVLVFNTATKALVATIPVGNEPDGIAITPDGSRVYVANENRTAPGSESVIDTATNTVVATIADAVGPRTLTVSPDGTRVYVAHFTPTSFNITVIGTATNTIVNTIAMGSGLKRVDGLAVSTDGSQLYAASLNANAVSVINTATGAITDTIVMNLPSGVAMTPDGTRAYVTNVGTSTVSVIDLATNTVATTVAVGSGSRGIAIAPDGRHAYVNNATARTVSVLALDALPVITTATLPGGAAAAAYTATIEATGSPAPQLSLTGTLPPGLTLDLASGVLAGTPTTPGSYTFTVTAASTVSGIAATVTQSYTVDIAPEAMLASPPLALSAAADGRAITLSWTVPTASGSSPITGYRIDRSVVGGAFTTLVADTASTGTRYTDRTAVAGQRYSYRVYAITGAGISATSNTATATVPVSTQPTATSSRNQQPAAPVLGATGPGGAPLAETGFATIPALAAAAGLLLLGTLLVGGGSSRRRPSRRH